MTAVHGHSRHGRPPSSEIEDTDGGAHHSREQLPPEEQWKMVAEFDRKATLGERAWMRRRVILTDEELLFGKVYSDDIVERIELWRITDVALDEDVAFSGGGDKKRDKSNDMTQEQKQRMGRFAAKALLDISKVDDYGRVTHSVLRGTEAVCNDWVLELRAESKDAQSRRTGAQDLTPLERFQMLARFAYNNKYCEFVVGFLIVLNFINTIVVYEIFTDPTYPNSTLAKTLDGLEVFFTWIFAVELFLNLSANLWSDFVHNGWSMFDLVVVPVTLVALYNPSLPAVGVLRLLRVLRVLKLFQRLSSLRVIINALLKSILPVLNAFVVLFLVTAIYAVVATMFFYKYDNTQFGKFSTSLYTMFQVCTGDGWSTDVVRPMFEFRSKGYSANCMPAGSTSSNDKIVALVDLENAVQSPACVKFLAEQGDSPWANVEWLAVMFFVSYIIIAGYFLLNIVVAVLLEEFARAVEEERESLAHANDPHSKVFGNNHLDPLMLILATFQSHEELRRRVKSIFTILDHDRQGVINHGKWERNAPTLDFEPPILFSPEDWDNLIKAGVPGADPRKVTYEHFQTIVYGQLEQFALRHTSHRMLTVPPNDQGFCGMMLSRQVLAEVRTVKTALKKMQEREREKHRAIFGHDGSDDDACSLASVESAHHHDHPEQSPETVTRKPLSPPKAGEGSFSPANIAGLNAGFDYEAAGIHAANILERRLDLKSMTEKLDKMALLDARVAELDGKLNHVIHLLTSSLENQQSPTTRLQHSPTQMMKARSFKMASARSVPLTKAGQDARDSPVAEVGFVSKRERSAAPAISAAAMPLDMAGDVTEELNQLARLERSFSKAEIAAGKVTGMRGTVCGSAPQLPLPPRAPSPLHPLASPSSFPLLSSVHPCFGALAPDYAFCADARHTHDAECTQRMT